MRKLTVNAVGIDGKPEKIPGYRLGMLGGIPPVSSGEPPKGGGKGRAKKTGCLIGRRKEYSKLFYAKAFIWKQK